MLYWLMKWVFLGPLMRLAFRPEVRGADNLPRTGGALVASNHLAVIDSFVLPLMVPRRMAFPAKAEYFTTPGPIGTLQRWFFTGMGQVPIERGNGRAARAALDTGIGVLREGRLFGIYPEGTRSPDGRLYKGRTGVARMALEARVPVVPVAMVGTDRANPVGSRFWRPVKIRIVIGEPIDFSRYFDIPDDRQVERAITDEVMYALMELSGQEYVDVYASKAKEEGSSDRAA
ncbi:1-acyl-sn-glycerol-3-phosphate acyltransferase [Actinomycetospora sp. TBRC 11914]|uniref:lysophospholipid acyltransferase family protein n=1 Tax=Actinomycetospora sp. TBRC 11914 TaxID=2729387 RepID=UPI00145EF7B7|nr:lysophospholipid acyltransferase family protein [Actinomycetospora sp. TBRC 11914]NMO93344.1 1-acyl-sn-glycerol-3-phosphate acyltransferase [Actinomycetospora sp. TBRC 11914]